MIFINNSNSVGDIGYKKPIIILTILFTIILLFMFSYSKSFMSANSEFLNLSKAKKVEISDCNLELCEYRFQIRYVSEQRIAFKFWNFGDLIKVDGILVDMYS